MVYFKYLSRAIGIFFELLLLGISIYCIIWWALSRISTRKEHCKNTPITIYLTNTGVHSDLVVPIKLNYQGRQIDFGKDFNLDKTFLLDTERTHLAFGWGDENFFMKTKNWSDLTAPTVFNAMFGLGNGALHLVQKKEPKSDGIEIKKIKLSIDQYLRLRNYFLHKLKKEKGQFKQIKKHPYSKYDFFFPTKNAYGLAYTCNSWINTALKKAGQKACIWTPFKDGLFVHR